MPRVVNEADKKTLNDLQECMQAILIFGNIQKEVRMRVGRHKQITGLRAVSGYATWVGMYGKASFLFDKMCHQYPKVPPKTTTLRAKLDHEPKVEEIYWANALLKRLFGVSDTSACCSSTAASSSNRARPNRC